MSPKTNAVAKVDIMEELQEKIGRARSLKMENDQLKSLAGEKSFRVFVESVTRDVVEPWPIPNIVIKKMPKDVIKESMVLHLSDWHAYEEVLKESVFNLNEYTSEVLSVRAKTVADRVVKLKRLLNKGGWHFKRLVIALNGDFISGTIHELERHSDAPNVMLADYGCGMTLAACIRDIVSHFDEVDIVCTSGNHTRLPDARKVQMKDPTRSWDTCIYLFAKTALQKLSHVKWHIPNSRNIDYEVEGWRFYQGHGHFIKSWQHIPFTVIMRMATNLNSSLAPQGKPIKYWLFGHFHNSSSLEMAGGESFVNGSLIGDTDYSVNGIGLSGDPKQMLLQVHKENGVTGRWPIFATGGVEGYPSKPWKF